MSHWGVWLGCHFPAGSIPVGDGDRVLPLPVGADGYVLTVDLLNPNLLKWAAGGTTAPGGSNHQLQFNNAGAFGGATDLTWETAGVLSFNLTGGGTFVRIQTVNGNFYLYDLASASYIFQRTLGLHEWRSVQQIDTTNVKIGWFGATVVVKQAANVALTDSTGGTPSTTLHDGGPTDGTGGTPGTNLADVTNAGLADPAVCNNNFATVAAMLAICMDNDASINARLTEIRTLLTTYGLGS